MAVFRITTLHLRFEFLLRFIRPYHIHDKYFYYFRNNEHYKYCVIQYNNASVENKLISSARKNVEAVEIISKFKVRENVMKLSADQVKDTLHLMANAEIDSVKFEDALKFIDEKCALSVNRWPLDLSLYILDAWFIILGPKVFKKHYYCAFSNLLNKKLKRCSKYNLILSLYFIGMSKKSPPFLMEFMEYKMEQFLSDLTDEEWAIACLSFFKTSTKISSEVLLNQCSKVAENLMLKNDRFNLISILKCLRLSDYFDENLIKMLSNFVKKEYKSFNFVECTNFLASYATQNVYDSEIYSCLEIQGMSELLKEKGTSEFISDEMMKIHPSERSRVKDLARFLWGMAFVGHNMDKMSLNFMIDFLNARIQAGEFESNLPILVDCVQSLILFGQYPPNIIEYVLNQSSLQKISVIAKAKPKYQLYFISRCAYLENHIAEIKNTKCFNNIPKHLEKEISQRQGFQEIIDFLNVNLEEKSFISCYILPHIMISGIFIATDNEDNRNYSITSVLSKLIEDGIVSKSIQPFLKENKVYTCVEILDPSVCVHGNNMPIGLMKMKICHLEKLNLNVITLSFKELNDFIKSGGKDCSKLQQLFM